MLATSPFRGLSAFPITPADPEGRVDTEALGHLVERLVINGVGSVAVLGSTGAFAYLDRSERRRAVAAAREALAGKLPLIVGIGALRTNWAQELARDAETDGADALLLPPMSYTPLTDDEVALHYEAVASATGLPTCIYNNPGTTQFTFSAALIARLSRSARIAAVKMPLPSTGKIGDELGRLRRMCASGFSVGYSGDWGATSALLAGADAWYSVIAGLLPGPAVKLTQAAQAGDAAGAAEIERAFEPLWALFRAHGSLRVVYALADLVGLSIGEPPLPIRLPADLSRSDLEKSLAALDQLEGREATQERH